jgi:DNA-binding NarL/FixJ family response regulator
MGPITGDSPIEIVIADDFSIIREGLISIISKHPELKTVAHASNGRELIDKVEQYRPDIVITDIAMPIMSGIVATFEITRRFPEVSVIALSSMDTQHLLKEMLLAGAKGYVLKNADANEIFVAIKKVYQNSTYYSSSTISSLVRQSTRTFSGTCEPCFTTKEIDVIKLMCQEYSIKEIAGKLKSTTRSVESARERILKKVGAKNMMGIALYAIRAGIFLLNEAAETMS